MMIVFFLWLLIVGFEIFRNYIMIEIDQERPVYWQSNVLRIAIGFTFWVTAPFLDSSMTWWQWWGMIPMMLLTFWFIFDYGLNLARKKKPFYYLNPKGSWLDQMQCKYPGSWQWFCWKFILMLGGLMIFHYGLNVIWEG